MQSLKNQNTRTLAYSVGRNFTTNWGSITERPILDRVVSTSKWPVPYYQRLFKAYPVREKKDKASLILSDYDIDDVNWYTAKETLRTSFKGREVLEWVENNLKTNTYILVQNDAAKMAKAYTSDIAQYLNIANRENRRILDKQDLI